VGTSNDGTALGIMGSYMGSLPLIVEMVNKHDVHTDYQLAKSAVANANAENDDASISFCQIACHNLEEELKSFE
jgi:hypothetical protein